MIVRYVQQRHLPDFSSQYAVLDSLTELAEVSISLAENDSAHAYPVDEGPQLMQVDDKTVNINTADRIELTSLPGIGPAMAGRIIEYRDRYGKFGSLDELKNVRGIGDKTFEKIQSRISL
jgi:comEA protein